MYLADQVRLGWSWLRDSFRTVRLEPIYFTAVVVFYGFTVLLLGMLPILGPLLAGLFWPFGSVMVAAAGEDAVMRRRPSIMPVVDAMKKPGTRIRMVRAGILYSIVAVTVGAIWAVLGAADIAQWEVTGEDRVLWESAAAHIPWLAITAAAAVYLPCMMALWFSPLLIHIKNMPLGKALFFSFMGCLRNLPAMAVALALALAAFTAAVGGLAAATSALGLSSVEMFIIFPVALLGTALVYGTYYPMWRSVFSGVEGDKAAR